MKHEESLKSLEEQTKDNVINLKIKKKFVKKTFRKKKKFFKRAK